MPNSDKKKIDKRYPTKTMTLPTRVAEMAEDLMREGGYDNFSAMVQELMRREWQRQEERKLELLKLKKEK